MEHAAEQPDPAPQTRSTQSGYSARHLVLWWCLWLLGSWAVALWRYNLSQAGQLMMLSIMAGLMLVWPAYRLSEAPLPGSGQGKVSGGGWKTSSGATPGSNTSGGGASGGSGASGVSGGGVAVLMDWVSLLIVSQAVFWPLQVVNHWPWYQAQALNASLAAWSFATGLLIVWGSGQSRAWPRWVAMVLCIILAGGGSLVTVALWLGGWASLSNDVLAYGPLAGVWAMAGDPSYRQQHLWMGQTVLVAAVSAMGWAGLAVIGLSVRNQGARGARGQGAE